MAAYSAETKIHAVEECYAGAGSLNQIAARFGVQRSTLQKWLLNYDLFGEDGLRHRVGNHHYPAIIKQQVVESYLSGQMSIEAVCKKYQLRSRSQLEQWVILYNGQKGFRSPGGRKGVQLAIDDITVQLIFASEPNREVPSVVRDMLKKSYLQRQAI